MGIRQITCTAIAVALVLSITAIAAHADVLRGTNGKNTLYGTEGPDVIDGKGGPDRIYGRGGNDDLYGRNGDDHIEGGFGDDRIWTSSGADEAFGGPGNDLIIDDYGHDKLHGGDGDDRIYGGSAPDDLYGDAGNDQIGGGTGSDLIEGGPGDDTLFGQQGRDTIDAGPGNDVVYANDDGWDKSIDCGDGIDTLYIDPSDTVAGQHDRKYIGDRYVNCENVIELAAGQDPNFGIAWDAPDDYSPSFGQGTALNDRMLGHHGSDRINGEAGDDVIWADSLPRGDASAITAQVDVVNAGPGNDTVYASPGSNTIFGGEGDDYLQGNVGDGLIDGGPGNDLIKLRSGGIYSVSAGPGDDRIVAIITSGEALINCGDGKDVVELPASPAARRLITIRRNCERQKIDGATRTTQIRFPRSTH